MKRAFDFFVSLIGLVFLSPLFIIVFFLVYFEDKYNPIYIQKRVGRKQKEFKMYKFRSMRINAEKDGGYSTRKDDSRITKIGKFIRQTSIDELPQLLNVLMGDMSLVGPRPDVPAQRCSYSEEEWALRSTVRPGITGLAQATSRSDATEEQRKNLDFYYIKNQTFLFDLKIIFLTFKQVFIKGSY